jgi:hypothetical protein
LINNLIKKYLLYKVYMNITLRKKLINEVKDYEKLTNLRVANIQKRKILGLNEEVEPYIQLNHEDIRKSEEITSVLKQILEKNLLLIRQFKENIRDNLRDNKYIIEISQIESVKNAYNNIILVFQNHRHTQETRSHIKRELVSLEHYIFDIINNLSDIISIMRAHNLKHIDIIIRAYTLYEIIIKQIQTNSFVKISDETIKHDYGDNINRLSKRAQDTSTSDFFSPPWDNVHSGYQSAQSGPHTAQSGYQSAQEGPQYYNLTEGTTPASSALYDSYNWPNTEIRSEDFISFPHDEIPSEEFRSQSSRRSRSQPSDDYRSLSSRKRTIESLHQDDDDFRTLSSDDFRSLSSKLNKEITHVAPTQMPTLGPSTSQSSSSGQPQQRTEETEPRPAQQTETMAASDRMIYKLGPRDITKGEVQKSVMLDALKELNKARIANGLQVVLPKGRDRITLYNLLKDYIKFINADGSDYVLEIGRGAPLTEIVEQVEATVPFNDVKNDPYFVVK